MRKLTLSIESLTVESFETARAHPALRGTVEGHARPTRDVTCLCPQSQVCPTLEPGCTLGFCTVDSLQDCETALCDTVACETTAC